jgi:hypothetical protein
MRNPIKVKDRNSQRECTSGRNQMLMVESIPAADITLMKVTSEKLVELLNRYRKCEMRPAIYDTNTNTLMVVSVNNSYS